MNEKERGDSLLEVVISTVIMGIIGVLMVSSIAVARPFADKMSLVGQTVQNLNTISESIDLQPFTPCSSTNPEPYAIAHPVPTLQASGNSFAIITSDLPPVMANSGTKTYQYSARLSVQNPNGSVTWGVEPLLPNGLSLNSSTGVISGSTDQAVTESYSFTARDNQQTATKSIMLTSALVKVLINPNASWTTCDSASAVTISYAIGDGTKVTYNYSGGSLNTNSVVTIWGSSNPAFDGSMLPISNLTSSTFTVNSSAVGFSDGGFANLSSVVNTQQVLVSTIVHGSPLHKVIAKAAA